MLFVPGFFEARPRYRTSPSHFSATWLFDSTFVLLIVADEASLNAKQEERLEWHAESAIINRGLNNMNLLTEALNEKGKRQQSPKEEGITPVSY